jgi:hypothetical protein
MSSMSEESTPNNSLDALESLYAAPRRPVERGEPPRLATISDAALARAKLEVARPLGSPGDRLETAMSEFVRRQIKPEAVPEPADLRSSGLRRLFAAGAIGVAVAIAIAAVVAVLFVTLFPKEKEAIESFAAAAPPAASPPQQGSDTPKVAASQFRALAPKDGGGENFTHEQSERLLQQFVQWRQKTALIDKP